MTWASETFASDRDADNAAAAADDAAARRSLGESSRDAHVLLSRSGALVTLRRDLRSSLVRQITAEQATTLRASCVGVTFRGGAARAGGNFESGAAEKAAGPGPGSWGAFPASTSRRTSTSSRLATLWTPPCWTPRRSSARGTRSSSEASRPASRSGTGGSPGRRGRRRASTRGCARASPRRCAAPATRRPRGRRFASRTARCAIASASSTRSARRRARRRRTSQKPPRAWRRAWRRAGRWTRRRRPARARAVEHLCLVASHLEAMGVPAPHVRVVPLLTPPETYHCSSYFEIVVPRPGPATGRDGDAPLASPHAVVAAGGRYDAWLAAAWRARGPGSSYAFDGVSRRGADADDYLHAPPGGVGVSVAVRKAAALAALPRRALPSRSGADAAGLSPLAGGTHSAHSGASVPAAISAAAATDVVVCARGGGGLLSERLHLAAELWKAGLRAETPPSACPSATDSRARRRARRAVHGDARRGGARSGRARARQVASKERGRVRVRARGGGGGAAGGAGQARGRRRGARRTFYEPNFRTRTFLNIFFESSMGTAFC